MEWIIFSVGLLCFLIVGISYYAYHQAFFTMKYKKKPDQPYTDEGPYRELADKLRGWREDLMRVPFEAVYIKAADGKRLYGRYYHVADGAPLHIEFHCYKGEAFRDFSGGDPFARKQGYNTLLVDQRAHGESAGMTITFGVKERLDVLAWVNYAVDRFGKDTKIFLSGISMGAATVLMAADLPLPDNVVGIIADSPYSSPKEILMKVCGDMKMPVRFIYPFLWLGAFLFGHFRIRGGAIESVGRARVPILILHGEGDGFVPCEMSAEIEKANPAMVRRYTFPGAGHGLSYGVDAPRYERLVKEFIDDCLKP